MNKAIRILILLTVWILFMFGVYMKDTVMILAILGSFHLGKEFAATW